MSKDRGADNLFKDLTNSGHKLRPRYILLIKRNYTNFLMEIILNFIVRTPEGVALTKRQRRDSSKVARRGMVTGRLEGSRQKVIQCSVVKPNERKT